MSVIHRGAKNSISFGEIKGDNRAVAVILFLNCNFLTSCDTLCIVINKKILLLVFLLVAVVLVFVWSTKNRIQTNEFAGNVVSVGDSFLVVKGTYTIDGKSIGTEGELKEVEVLVDSSTQIARESFKIPEGVGSFNPDKLPKQVIKVGLDQIKKDTEFSIVGVMIEAQKNIYGKNKFIASVITYRVPDLTGE